MLSFIDEHESMINIVAVNSQVCITFKGLNRKAWNY